MLSSATEAIATVYITLSRLLHRHQLVTQLLCLDQLILLIQHYHHGRGAIDPGRRNRIGALVVQTHLLTRMGGAPGIAVAERDNQIGVTFQKAVSTLREQLLGLASKTNRIL